MRRSPLLPVAAGSVLALCALAATSPSAQPDPYRPVMNDGSYELVLPPGTYTSIVVAFEGGASTKTLRATVKAPSGEMTLLVSGGETLIVPLSASGWTITSEARINLNQPTSQVHASALTPAGPVKLEAAKK